MYLKKALGAKEETMWVEEPKRTMNIQILHAIRNSEQIYVEMASSVQCQGQVTR